MLWWGESQTLRLGRRVWFLVFWGTIGGMAGKALPNGGRCYGACGMVRLCDVGVLRERRFCGRRSMAGLVSEGDGAVGGLGLRQKGLAAL